jgi:transcriptional regulator with XRE-family HTH domain
MIMEGNSIGVMKMEQVTEALKALRKALHLSQRELSERMGCSRLSVTYWETNQTSPSRYWLEKWLKALSDAVLDLKDNEKGRSDGRATGRRR